MEFTYFIPRQLKKKKKNNGFQFFQISVLNFIPVSNFFSVSFLKLFIPVSEISFENGFKACYFLQYIISFRRRQLVANPKYDIKRKMSKHWKHGL